MQNGSYWFCTVFEIENAIFQDLESFGTREDFQSGYGKILNPKVNVA